MATSNQLDLDLVRRHETEASTMIERIEAMQIVTAEDFEAAGKMIIEGKKQIKELESERLTITRPIDESKKRVIEIYKRPISLIEQGVRMLSSKYGEYDREQKRIAEEARRKEEERRRKEAEAEREKIRRQAEAAAKKAEELRLKAEAEEDEAKRRAMEEKAERFDDKAVERSTDAERVQAAPVVEKIETPKTTGIAMHTVWKFQIIDEGSVPDEYKMIDEKKVGAVVRALKDKARIPGVRVYSEQSVRGTGR